MTSCVADELAFLLGSFTGTDVMHPSEWAPGGAASSVIEASTKLDRTIVVQQYEQRRDGEFAFGSLAVWMLDPAVGDLLYYAFDTAGFPADPPARGRWLGSDLVLERTTPRGSSRLVVTPDTDGWHWQKQFRVSDAAAWTPVFEAEFRPRVAGLEVARP